MNTTHFTRFACALVAAFALGGCSKPADTTSTTTTPSSTGTMSPTSPASAASR